MELKTPDVRIMMLRHMNHPGQVQNTITQMRQAAPEYLVTLLKDGHTKGVPEEELRALLNLSPDAILEQAEPFWNMLMAEAAIRKISIPAAKTLPNEGSFAQALPILEEIRATLPQRFPVPLYTIHQTRAMLASNEHPLLPNSWVDAMRILPGLTLGALRLFAPDGPEWSDPSIQIHKQFSVFGRSGKIDKELLHVYAQDGRCYVLSRSLAEKGKIQGHRAVTSDFSQYLSTMLPKAFSRWKIAKAAKGEPIESVQQAVLDTGTINSESVPPVSNLIKNLPDPQVSIVPVSTNTLVETELKIQKEAEPQQKIETEISYQEGTLIEKSNEASLSEALPDNTIISDTAGKVDTMVDELRSGIAGGVGLNIADSDGSLIRGVSYENSNSNSKQNPAEDLHTTENQDDWPDSTEEPSTSLDSESILNNPVDAARPVDENTNSTKDYYLTENSHAFTPSLKNPIVGEGILTAEPDFLGIDGSPIESTILSFSTDAQKRKDRSERIIRSSLRTESSPLIAPSYDDDAVLLRPPGSIAWRCKCLLAVIGWASGFRIEDEARASGVPSTQIERTLGEELQKRLTERERLFLSEQPTEEDGLIIAEKIEAIAVLLRALGILKKLPPPGEPVNPDIIFNLGFESLIRRQEKPVLSMGEAAILDLLDLYRRLHWVAKEARNNGYLEQLSINILKERRHALEWLVSSAERPFPEWGAVDLSIPMLPGR